MSELKKCPICHEQAKIGYACGDYFAHCSDGCPSPMCDHPNENTTACSWNDWAKWYEKNRRAQPENSRQHALQTGVCPMCEDCPDGCPIETPNDSRNKPENEPLTLGELREMQGEPVYVIRMQGAKIKMWVIACPNEYGLTQDRNAESQLMAWNTYGRVWLAYRAKPKEEHHEAD